MQLCMRLVNKGRSHCDLSHALVQNPIALGQLSLLDFGDFRAICVLNNGDSNTGVRIVNEGSERGGIEPCEPF